VEDDAGGDARLILRGAVQVGADAIDLKDAKGDKRSHVPVEAAAQSAGPGGIRSEAKLAGGLCKGWADAKRILGFPCETKQDVSKRREFRGQ